MARLPHTIVTVGPKGEKEYLTCLPAEWVGGSRLPEEAVIGALKAPLDGEVKPAGIEVNPAFVDFLQDLIARCGPEFPSLLNEGRVENGRLYVFDRRTRTPDKDIPRRDVFGAFDLKDGKIVPGSYWRSPDYVVVTEDGLAQPPLDLAAKLLAELGARVLPPPTAHAPADDVDPVQEAEVYIAYGRDAQAAEILAEALQKDASRADVRAKLAEVQARLHTAQAPATPAAGDPVQRRAELGLALLSIVVFFLGFSAGTFRPVEWHALGFDFGDGSYNALLIVAAAMPWAAFAMSLRWPQSTLDWLFPAKWMAIGASAYVLWFRGAVDAPTLTDEGSIGPRAGAMAALAALLVACHAWVAWRQSAVGLEFVSSVLFGGVCFLAYSYGATKLANQHFDRAPAEIRPATVLERKVCGRFCVQVVTELGAVKVVKWSLKRTLKAGDTVCVHRHPGALGVPWLEVVRC